MAAADEQVRPPWLLLPEDLLVDILARLPPRGVASSRSVCKPWRDAVDSRHLLRTDLLPLSLGGIFLNLNNGDGFFSPFFHRPSLAAISDGILDCFGGDTTNFSGINDHCNGLLLFDKYVVNPATLQCASLPPPPPPPPYFNHIETFHDVFLVFDPTVSVHYEVFLVPRVLPTCYFKAATDAVLSMEWPPWHLVLRVFSSRTALWEERSFARRGQAIGTVAHILSQQPAAVNNSSDNGGTYCRGRLYLQYDNDFVMRINMSNGTYQLVEPPNGIDASKHPKVCLGKSEKGVYYASVNYECRLQVWYLLDDEQGGGEEWVLKCDTDMKRILPCGKFYYDRKRRSDGPWLLRFHDDYDKDEELEAALTAWRRHNDDDADIVSSPCPLHHGVLHAEDDLDWSSDIEENNNNIDPGGEPAAEKDDDDDDRGNKNNKYYCPFDPYIDLLGFHPYKEVVFLHRSHRRGISYHLNGSKVQDIGSLFLSSQLERILMYFPYTPCWIREFPGDDNNFRFTRS